MKYLKFFENHSKTDSLRSEILDDLGIKKLAYDIIDTSFDNLDKVERDEEDNIMDKSLIFEIIVDDAYLFPIIHCEFSLNNNFSEKDINWLSNKERDLEEIINSLKSNSKIIVLISIIGGEEGNKEQLDCNDVVELLQDLYPDIEFNTFDPWDIN